jgi:hypothetical protein
MHSIESRILEFYNLIIILVSIIYESEKRINDRRIKTNNHTTGESKQIKMPWVA